jgi:acetyltransferase-like isoleucine patch superfamily enzyme
VVIGYNARIGSHTTIMPGITIGENAIVGANSFVTRDIPKNTFFAGCPAKLIKELHE